MSSPYEIWRNAENLHSIGRLDEAASLYAALQTDPHFFLKAHTRLAEYQAPPKRPLNPHNLKLVWQTGISGPGGHHGEGCIVRHLLKSTPICEEIDDSDPALPHQHKYTQFHPDMIVVDHVIKSAESFNYYRECRRRGCNLILIHLADEGVDDLIEIYEYCNFVFRNYWSPIVSRLNNVYFFPLGDNTSIEYPEINSAQPITQRLFHWNFLGDPNKADRPQAIQAFLRIPNHKLHIVNNFFDPNKIGPKEYRHVLANSKFTLCPDGNVNIDTFRFWEAIEFGSIPVIVPRTNFPYFESLLNSDLPFPTFKNWEEAAQYVSLMIQDEVRLLLLQSQMQVWWSEYKADLPFVFSDALNQARKVRCF